ncbi:MULTISPECIES: hypothetical protein [Acidithrix]|uniref:Uncharacterized protein n=1 Tax=Acidithrix ferrooxidans TaxID=1280514 RepID=A0A0D8HH32_9ACTN|nr:MULTISPECIES: hypothetical protein [Acidithrix]KJF16361.1 hypothetical protein AXFE_28060 [Acidithrix ferrooxidans]
MFFAFSIPIIGILFLGIAPAVGWSRQKRKIEEARLKRARLHSSERARLIAQSFPTSQSAEITGVVNFDATILIGYKRDFPKDGSLTPGETVGADGTVTGTWVAWTHNCAESDISRLQTWSSDTKSIVYQVDSQSSDLTFIEPISQEKVKVQLVPS